MYHWVSDSEPYWLHDDEPAITTEELRRWDETLLDHDRPRVSTRRRANEASDEGVSA
jgi:hypothetical protein